MYLFGVMLFFAAVIVPPILAIKGRGRRGVWAALAFASLLLALLEFVVAGKMLTTPEQRDAAWVATGLVWIFFGSFLGGIFATCLYKKRAEQPEGNRIKASVGK